MEEEAGARGATIRVTAEEEDTLQRGEGGEWETEEGLGAGRVKSEGEEEGHEPKEARG